MSKLIAAHTPPEPLYPPYINISQDGDNTVVTVRGPIKADGSCGDVAAITLSGKQWADVLSQILQHGHELSDG